LLATAGAELWKLQATRAASFLRLLHWSAREVIRPGRKPHYRYAIWRNCTFRAQYGGTQLG